jgi:enoyl-CoA hydratase/carnithine racemase
VSADTYESLSVERDGAVLRVWLDRPERLNVIDNIMLEELASIYGSVGTDFAVRVVVLGGRGRTFCAGFEADGDLIATARRDPEFRARFAIDEK